MRENIKYLLMAVGVLASCTNDHIETEAVTYLDGSSKTPIAVKTNLYTAPVTRAFDKTFEENDQLFAYIEAGKQVGEVFTPVSQFTWADDFTIGETIDNGGTPEGTGLITTSDKLSPTLYWDDFSSTEYDLREDGRGIRLKYGYCYNGGQANASNNTTDAAKEAGTLTWSVATDQSAAEGVDMKKSDLLYAATQDMITYGHDVESRGTLTLPYTHAMSKITINVKTGESYDAEKANFASSVLTLKNMQVKSNVNAPAATVTAVSTDGTADVKTFNKSKANTAATYQAIVGPTYLTAGDILAAITDIDGNNYNLPLTAGILSAWSSDKKMEISEEVIENGVAQAKPYKPMTRVAEETIDGGKGYTTKPGIHYILDVTVEKQKITIRATITDWESVTAEGKAAINFTGDVTEKGSIADELKAKGFDVYKSSSASSFAVKSTTVTYADSKWTYTPTIYWAGQSDASYFRAISPAGNSSSELAQGTDLMWGTSGDAAINPRTGDVALNFDHIMSKLCVNLETTSDASAVNLTGAKIQITNLATAGTFNIVDGSVTASSSKVANIFTDNDNKGKASGFTEYVVPQTIGDDAKLVITLADGTTYSLQLNQCVETGTETAVSAWASGKSYTYTIHLEKENITFRALVKDWDPATGSGNANLEWD